MTDDIADEPEECGNEAEEETGPETPALRVTPLKQAAQWVDDLKQFCLEKDYGDFVDIVAESKVQECASNKRVKQATLERFYQK